MTWLGVGSASSRRTMIAVLVAGFMGTAINVQAQDAPPPASEPAQAQAPAAPPQDDPFRFKSDAALVFWSVNPAQTATFERVWSTIRARLEASDRADVRALGQSIKIFKPEGPPGPQGATYFFVIDPTSKTLSYQPSPFLLFETGAFEDAEARQLYEQLSAAVTGINPAPVTAVALPSAAPPPPAPAAPPAGPAAPAPQAP